MTATAAARPLPPAKKLSLKDPEPYTYDLGELVSFYAGISEVAEVETLEKQFNPSIAKPEQGYVFWCVRTVDGNELAGLMRAWRDQTQGIVYDISVSPEHRREGAGKMLRDKALAIRSEADQGRIHWHGNPYRISPNLDRGLAIIRTLYAISFVLGFQKMGEAIYFLVLQEHPQLMFSFSNAIIGLLALLTIGLALLGFRFFWAVGNIRRFVLLRICELQPPKRLTLMMHLAFLFSFPVLFFFLCRLFQDFCSTLAVDVFIGPFVVVFASLLLLNALWLRLLTRDPGKRSRESSGHGSEALWIVNNVLCGVLALACLTLGNYFKWPEIPVAYCAGALFLINSLVDLLGTSEAYILGDAFAGG